MTIGSTTVKLFDTVQANHGVLHPATDRPGGPEARPALANEALLGAHGCAALLRAHAARVWVVAPVLEADRVVLIAMCREDMFRAADPGV